MVKQITKITEISQVGRERAAIFELPDKYSPTPGQFLPCQQAKSDPDDCIINLFPMVSPTQSLALGSIPENWNPGDLIAYLPPQGHGFLLPTNAQRVGLLALNTTPARVLTLSRPALAQGAAVTLFYDSRPEDHSLLNQVPLMIEVMPCSALSENLDWLDFLAIELAFDDRDSLSTLLPMGDPPFAGQVLIQTAMPCRGLGVCSACAVRTRHGWRMACSDGPVFPLQEVLHVAG